MIAAVYSPPPSEVIADGVVAPLEGSTTAFAYRVTRNGMSWHLAADVRSTAVNRLATHTNITTPRFILASTHQSHVNDKTPFAFDNTMLARTEHVNDSANG
jgi:hypothetical protein